MNTKRGNSRDANNSRSDANNGGNTTLMKKKTEFPHILGNSDGIGCKVIYEEGLPNI
jgi:hypothetical protein